MNSSPLLTVDSDQPPTLAPILSEICVRLIEMDEIKALSSVRLVASLFRLSCDSVPAYRLLLAISTSDDDAVSSYANAAASRGISRQAAHKDFHIQLAHIERHFPQIAVHINHLRESAHAGHGNNNSKTHTQ